MVMNPPLKIVHKMHFSPPVWVSAAGHCGHCSVTCFQDNKNATRYLWLIPRYVCMPPELQEYYFGWAVCQSHSCWLDISIMPWETFHYGTRLIRTNWLYFGRRRRMNWTHNRVWVHNQKINPFIKHPVLPAPFFSEDFVLLKWRTVHTIDEKDKASKCILLTAHWLCHSALQLHRWLLIQHLHVWSAESAMLVWQCEYVFYQIMIFIQCYCCLVFRFSKWKFGFL